MSMMMLASIPMAPPGVCYRKPFDLYHYNKPKLPPLKIKKQKPSKNSPKIPLRLNNATKMRNKVIKEYSAREKDPYVDYQAMNEEALKGLNEEPDYVATDTKTSQYRYKWVRDIPVVSCRFTEHVMMHHKPPFTFTKGECTLFRLRTMQLKDPEKEQDEESDKEQEFIPSILQ